MKIARESIERFSTSTTMIAHLGTEGRDITEDTVVDVEYEGIRLGTASILTVFNREGLPSPDDEDRRPYEMFVADLKLEGLIPVDVADDDPAIEAAIDSMNARGATLFRVQYQATFDPEDGWEEALEAIDSGKVPDPDADKFKTGEEMEAATAPEEPAEAEEAAKAPASDLPFAVGGHLVHAGAKYEIFDVRGDEEDLQAAAVYSGVKPNVVRLNFDQVKGYEAPISPLDQEFEVAFNSPAVQNFEELQEGYERAVTVARSLIRRNQELEAHLKSIHDPSTSILVDLKPHAEEIARRHNPESNTALDALQVHYVITAQLLTERMVAAMAKVWAAFDHHVLDNIDEENVTTKLDMSTALEFTDLESASISNAKLKLKLSSPGGVTLTLPRVIQPGSRSPDQPTLFDENAFRPSISTESDQEVEDDGETDVPELPAEDPKGNDVYHSGYGVTLTNMAFEALTEKQQAQVTKWLAIMGGEDSGVKKFPTCLKQFVQFEPGIYEEDGENAFQGGVKSTEHDLDPGSGQHYFWRKGFDRAKKAAGAE